MSGSPLFAIRDIYYNYGKQHGLQGITLDVPTGGRVALLGANGSGKSTLLRVLNGLYQPVSGQVSFDGAALDEERLLEDSFAFLFRRRVALLFQDPDVQLFNATVFDEVAFGPLQLLWPKEKIKARVEHTLQALGIQELRDRAPYRLSGGEKKRVALASILVLDPEVLLLDEPTAALDPRSQGEFLKFLRGLDKRKTVITATHDLDIVQQIAGYCYILQEGRVIAEGSTESVLGDASLLERANLIQPRRR